MQVGTRLEHFEILEHLGSGGMGSVYRARDLTLQRDVALKVLPPEVAGDGESLERFRREATILAGLNHPGIASIHSVHEADGVVFLALELVDGDSLSQALAAGPLSARETLAVAAEVAAALEAAHERGVVHRDLKPSNVMRDRSGRVKVLDFGIAKLAAAPEDEALVGDEPTQQNLTADGALLGTVPFMSPEQLQGTSLDQRTDVWSFGCLIFELATGRSPFLRDSAPTTMAAILEAEPDWGLLPADLPEGLRSAIPRCLAKDRDARLDSMGELRRQFEAALSPERTPRTVMLSLTAAVILIAVIGAAFWDYQGVSSERRAREVLLPEIERLTVAEQYTAAVALAHEAAASIPAEEMVPIWERISRPATLLTEPSGAAIELSEIREPAVAGGEVDATVDWQQLGASPQSRDRLPLGTYRLRLTLDGYEPFEEIVQIATGAEPHVRAHVPLIPLGTLPPGMSYLQPRKLRASVFNLGAFDPAPDVTQDPAYLLATTEVTNAAFHQFVESGGYADRSYWEHEFRAGGRALTWEEARSRFVDRTGRPGPATWEAGTYPVGEDAHPVAGISWYEAAAFARFADAALPTIFHWTSARDRDIAVTLIATSNFAQAGTLPVGSTPFGTHGLRDMAGNVREWAWNAVGESRYILGGAYNDPYYAADQGDLLPPMDRSPTNGVRLAHYLDATPAQLAALLAPIDAPAVRYSWGTDVSDEVFEVLARHYDYDPVPLATTPLATDEATFWIREKVEFSTGYGERMAAFLYVPRNAAPPLQTVVYFPGVDVMRPIPSDRPQGEALLSEIIKGGRAVLYPIYRETYERNLGVSHNARSATREYAERKGHWIQDVRRAVDYLASREDIDMSRLAYYGLSWGAEHGPIALVVEPRFRTAVLSDAGALLVEVLPEVDESVFAPRVQVPVLMLNGTHDYIFPVETSQLPFFERLGTPRELKRHVTFESGHVVAAAYPDEVTAEIRRWLDETLGPVR